MVPLLLGLIFKVDVPVQPEVYYVELVNPMDPILQTKLSHQLGVCQGLWSSFTRLGPPTIFDVWQLSESRRIQIS